MSQQCEAAGPAQKAHFAECVYKLEGMKSAENAEPAEFSVSLCAACGKSVNSSQSNGGAAAAGMQPARCDSIAVDVGYESERVSWRPWMQYGMVCASSHLGP